MGRYAIGLDSIFYLSDKNEIITKVSADEILENLNILLQKQLGLTFPNITSHVRVSEDNGITYVSIEPVYFRTYHYTAFLNNNIVNYKITKIYIDVTENDMYNRF